MSPSAPDILERLLAIRRTLRLRRSVQAPCLALGVVGALLVLLEFWDMWHPLRETLAALLLALILLGGLGVLAAMLFRALFMQASCTELTCQVEREHPALMNTLSCAVEQLSLAEEDRGVFGSAVIEKAEQSTSGIDLCATLMPSRLSQWRLALSGLICVLLFAAGLAGNPAHKAWAWASAAPAFAVLPGSAEVPMHSDLVVEASVRRWENVADIEFEDSGGRHRFAMNEAADGFTFTFYDLMAPLRYRILSPSAVSPWYQLGVYRAPDYESIHMVFSPPAYTQRPEHTSDSWGDAAAVEGSRVQVRLSLPEGIAADWVADGQRVPFQASADKAGGFLQEFRLERSMSVQISLRDKQGHERETSSARFEMIPDQPPTVDVLRPRKDRFLPPGEALQLSALAADDYGLSEVVLHLSVSGTPLPPRRLLEGAEAGEDVAAEKTVESPLDTASLGLQAGSVVSGYFVAADNRRPQTQSARSQVFFLEIRAESEEPAPQEGQNGEKQEIDIGRLIAESKRLIRLSYDLAADWRVPSDTEHAELSRGLADLRNEVLSLTEEVKTSAQKKGLAGDIPHLSRAASALESAERQVQSRRVNESIGPQEQALTWLVRLAQELRKNQTASSEGKKSAESSPSQKSQKGGEQAQAAPSLAERLQQLRNALAEVSELARQQAELNQQLESGRNLKRSPAERRELNAGQEELRRQADSLQAGLRKAKLHAPAASLNGAGEAMRSAAGNIKKGAAGAAAREGVRAHSGLLAAEESLRESMRRVAGAAVNALAAQARSLAQSEENAAKTSRQFAEAKPKQQELDAARNQQGQLRSRSEQLLTAVDRAAADVHETFPRAAETLGTAAAKARRERLTNGMKRAENALLYQRFETAAASQGSAAQKLQRLADALEEGAGQLPTLGRQELLQALQEIRSAQKRMERVAAGGSEDGQAAARQLQQTGGRMGRELQRLGRELGEPGLGNLGMLLEEGGAGGAAERAAYASGLLQRAGRLVEKHVLREDVRRAYRISRRATDVPEQYRDAVDEYFRRLSEE